MTPTSKKRDHWNRNRVAGQEPRRLPGTYDAGKEPTSSIKIRNRRQEPALHARPSAAGLRPAPPAKDPAPPAKNLRCRPRVDAVVQDPASLDQEPRRTPRTHDTGRNRRCRPRTDAAGPSSRLPTKTNDAVFPDSATFVSSGAVIGKRDT